MTKIRQIRQIPMLSKPHNHSLMNNGFIEDSSSDDQNEDQKSGLTQLGAIEKLALYRRQIKMQMMSKPHNALCTIHYWLTHKKVKLFHDHIYIHIL